MGHFTEQRHLSIGPNGGRDRIEMQRKYDTIRMLLKPEPRKRTIKMISNAEPPGSLHQIRQIPYNIYKEFTKWIYHTIRTAREQMTLAKRAATHVRHLQTGMVAKHD